jgi:DNA-binding SARP family transcriptional activator
MFPLHIYLFGKFEIECHEQALAGLETHKAQELLSYLLLYRDRAQPREILADLLGNHEQNIDLRKSFRQALWRLQTALDSRPESRNCGLLWVEPDWIQLNPKATFWLDVVEFEAAFGAVYNIEVEKFSKSRIGVNGELGLT